MTDEEAVNATPTPTQEPTTLDIVADCFRQVAEHSLSTESRLDNEQRDHSNTRWSLMAMKANLGEAHRVMDDRLLRIDALEKLLNDAKVLVMHGGPGPDLRATTLSRDWHENRDRWLDNWTELYAADPRKEDRPQLTSVKQPEKQPAEDSDDNLL